MPLDDFPIRLELPVLWGNQDLFGHVNNCIHIRWFESSRVAYWDAGIGELMKSAGNLGPILANVTCNYKSQIRYPDTVHVGASVRKLGRTSLTMEHVVYCEMEASWQRKGSRLWSCSTMTSSAPSAFPKR